MSIKLAYGLPGTGKSTLLHDMARAQAHSHVFFVVDHEMGWGEDSPLWRGDPPRIEVTSLADLGDRLPTPGVYVFRYDETLPVAERAIAIGNVVVVDDELDLSARRKGWEQSPLRVFVHQGRHALNAEGIPCEIHLLGACRRPQNLHTDITELAAEFFVFRLKGKRTLGRLEDDSIIEDDDWNRIREQPNFNFLHWPSGEWLAIPPL